VELLKILEGWNLWLVVCWTFWPSLPIHGVHCCGQPRRPNKRLLAVVGYFGPNGVCLINVFPPFMELFAEELVSEFFLLRRCRLWLLY
jgi:hypothetical protein